LSPPKETFDLFQVPSIKQSTLKGFTLLSLAENGFLILFAAHRHSAATRHKNSFSHISPVLLRRLLPDFVLSKDVLHLFGRGSFTQPYGDTMSTRQRQPAGLFETLRREMRLKGYSHETMEEYLGRRESEEGGTD
jgi:hypothetical protein